jgi:hypothetical protein
MIPNQLLKLHLLLKKLALSRLPVSLFAASSPLSAPSLVIRIAIGRLRRLAHQFGNIVCVLFIVALLIPRVVHAQYSPEHCRSA